MDVAGGHHQFPQFLPQLNDLSVVVPQILVGFCRVLLVFQHEAVVGQGLDFQKVVEGGDSLQFVMALAVQQRLEQFARFTGRADDQALPHLKQFRLRNSGNPAEMLQVGIGNQVVEVPQTHLIFGKEDNMPGLPVGDAPAGAQAHHGRIDGLQGVDVVFFLQHGHELGHNQAAGHGVVPGPVVVEVRQIQGIGHDVQLEFVQVPQKVLGQNQGVGGSELVFKALPLALCPDEAGIKVRIVGNQHPIADKVQKFWQHFFDFWRTHQHFFRNSGEFHNFPFQMPFRVYEGLEAVNFLPIFQDHRADFDDSVGF